MVLVQDVHLNTEAQKNIAVVLQELINQRQVGLVGVEGAFTPFDFKPFRDFSNKEITRLVAEDFLKQNLMAAPSLVGITSPVEPPTFVGIDDATHYRRNVQAYLDSGLQKEKVSKELERLNKELTEKKRTTFSPDLRRFDDLRTAHHAGHITFGAYVKNISKFSASSDFVIEQFLSAYSMESTLNTERVETERRSVLEKLIKRLSQAEMSDLLAQSLAYRMGRLGFGDYYQGLKDLCERKGVNLSQTPAFESYIRYVLLSDGIKAEAYSPP